MFADMPLEDQQFPYIILNTKDIILEWLLKFMYSGRICESMTEAMKEELLSVSKFLVIKSLYHFLCKTTEEKVKSQKRYETKLAIEAEEDRQHAKFLNDFFSDVDSLKNGESDTQSNYTDSDRQDGGYNTVKVGVLRKMIHPFLV